ncbi:MAG: UDP-N-acetylmuramate--alanine ligase [Bacteroidetes bacterium]|nr:UDP-N-acetylmuramate--alanine ligase [Bacteroidota bacterium]
MGEDILSNSNFFFVGVGGAGMSAIAQYLAGNGKQVKGSDRLFASFENDFIKQQLTQEGIQCFLQDGSGIDENTQVLVVSTAIEDTNPEVAKAKLLNIPIVIRAQLLADICASKRTIAIAGTSGKSTVTAMLFHILHENKMSPSLISGAGLVSLQKQGKIGNSYCGSSDVLVIEADESDGTLVKYHPEIGVLLNIDKDHKELAELDIIFETFQQNTQKYFVVNNAHPLARKFSKGSEHDFGEGTDWVVSHFVQQGFEINFEIQGVVCKIPTIGKHNMENALAAMSIANLLGITIQQSASALGSYQGIYRRHQCIGKKNGITLIDDYAHNPAKIAASIRACQPIANKLIAWFQPHGYGPTRFIRKELVEEITASLRPQDEMWMSEIYYAGGTAVKDISAADIIGDLQQNGVHAFFVADRNALFDQMIPTLQKDTVILLMGARDPGLEKFAGEVWGKL